MRRFNVQKSPGGLFFLAAVAIAIAAGAASWFFIQSAVPSVPVLAAKTELTPGMLITEDSLAVVE
ncbi:MAG: hypothetical protein IBX71_11390, partial [Candidatus Desulforudis sp.]|nr:hypothetical protein [Desulforudis sp.]